MVFLLQMTTAEKILQNRGLKKTPNRMQILEVFLSKDYALSYADIESLINGKMDKATIYRALKSFQENGIIHEVFDGSNSNKYGLCAHQTCSHQHHEDAHAHFKCVACAHTFCLDQTLPALKLPPGYQVENMQILVEGKCPNCQ